MAKRNAKITKGLEYKRSFKIGDSWHTFKAKGEMQVDIEFASRTDLDKKSENLFEMVHDQVLKDLADTVEEFKKKYSL